MAGRKPQQRFFQQLMINGKEAPIFSIVSATYIEAMSLDGPQLILNINDLDGNLRDTMGLVSGAKLELIMGDVSGRGEAYFRTAFKVVSIKPDGRRLRVEAIEATVYQHKHPAPAGTFFIDRRVKEVLMTLFQGYTINTTFTSKVNYHINMGGSAIAMLEKMARDLGAAIWVARNTVYCLPRDQLGTREKDYPVLEYQAQKSQHPIQAFKPLYNNPAAARSVQRNYMSWDTVGGLMASPVNPTAPRQFVAGATLDELDKMGACTVPAMTCDMPGNGSYTAGMTVGVRLHRLNREAVLDESLPPKQVIMTVSHIEENSEYRCKLTTGAYQL